MHRKSHNLFVTLRSSHLSLGGLGFDSRWSNGWVWQALLANEGYWLFRGSEAAEAAERVITTWELSESPETCTENHIFCSVRFIHHIVGGILGLGCFDATHLPYLCYFSWISWHFGWSVLVGKSSDINRLIYTPKFTQFVYHISVIWFGDFFGIC